MFFVANRNVAKGSELCFSYIEHELLCENSSKRSALLDMDFELQDGDDSERPNKRQKVAKMPAGDQREGGVCYPVIDAEMQSELMSTPATERLELVDELLSQSVDPEQDYQCDKYQLRILKAITLDGLGRYEEAMAEWESALDFAVTKFPPLDESIIALRVQAALSARCCRQTIKAKTHSQEALRMHNALFGGDRRRFLKRYDKELSSPLKSAVPPATMVIYVQELFGE